MIGIGRKSVFQLKPMKMTNTQNRHCSFKAFDGAGVKLFPDFKSLFDSNVKGI